MESRLARDNTRYTEHSKVTSSLPRPQAASEPLVAGSSVCLSLRHVSIANPVSAGTPNMQGSSTCQKGKREALFPTVHSPDIFHLWHVINCFLWQDIRASQTVSMATPRPAQLGLCLSCSPALLLTSRTRCTLYSICCICFIFSNLNMTIVCYSVKVYSTALKGWSCTSDNQSESRW